MKKTLITFLLMPIYVFAFKIGTNYVGAGIDFIELDGSISGSSGNMDGEGFLLQGNYNILSESKYGVDFLGGFGIAKSLESNSFETDIASYAIGIRPFLPFPKGSIYVDGLYQWAETELKVKNTSLRIKADGDTFVPSFGVEFLAGDFIFNPSLSFINSDLDGQRVNLGLSYNINQTYSVGIGYSYVDYDPVTLNGTDITVEEKHIKLGLTYSF